MVCKRLTQLVSSGIIRGADSRYTGLIGINLNVPHNGVCMNPAGHWKAAYTNRRLPWLGRGGGARPERATGSGTKEQSNALDQSVGAAWPNPGSSAAPPGNRGPRGPQPVQHPGTAGRVVYRP